MSGSGSTVHSRPVLLGHRGLRPRGLGHFESKVPNENTFAAFEYALSHGCDGFEFDVRHTRDGRNVLWHDPIFNGREIASTDFMELTVGGNGGLPCLEEVLQKFGSRACLDIELKVTGREESVVAALKQHPPQRGYVVTSFLPAALRRLHAIDDQIPLGYICEHREMMNAWRELPTKVFLPRYDLVRPELIEEVHRAGRQVMVWTVNEPSRMQQLAQWGADGLISDDPALLYRTFHFGSEPNS